MSTTLENIFSQNIKRWRGTRSQSDMAKILGLNSQQAYAKYESGVSLPQGETRRKFAEVLMVEESDLFTPNGIAEPTLINWGSQRIKNDMQALAESAGMTLGAFVLSCAKAHAKDFAKVLLEQREKATSSISTSELKSALASAPMAQKESRTARRQRKS